MSEQSKPAEGGMQPGSPEVKKTFTEAAQRHHDYYVGLEQSGQLPEEDRANLELAKQREQAGQVKPFSPVEAPANASGHRNASGHENASGHPNASGHTHAGGN